MSNYHITSILIWEQYCVPMGKSGWDSTRPKSTLSTILIIVQNLPCIWRHIFEIHLGGAIKYIWFLEKNSHIEQY